MDLLSIKTIKELLLKYETRPSKGLGQNFLIDKNILEKIIDSADIKPNDIILEVGPGIGTLTQELAKRAGKVIAVEKDKKMCEILEETLKDFKNVEVINTDILKIPNIQYLISNKNRNLKCQKNREIRHSEIKHLIGNWELGIGNYKIVANIPYYLTSPLIRKFLENPPAGGQPQEMILMLQKEVAQRICSKPPDMSLLAVSVQFYAEPKIISYVSKNCFWPSPKIDSAIIKIVPRHQTSRNIVGRQTSHNLFFQIVKAGFSQPRKQLVGNLSKMLKLERAQTEKWLTKNNIKPNQRAETLSVEDWIKLVSSL